MNHAQHAAEPSVTRMALDATRHCLTGCAIGEIVGLVVSGALGLTTEASVLAGIVLAFVFGYSLTFVPLLRGGHADFEGTWHAAHDLDQRPVGPRPGAIPIMIGGHGPKGLRHAARLADIWSCYAEERSDVEEMGPRVVALERRAPRWAATRRRSVGRRASRWLRWCGREIRARRKAQSPVLPRRSPTGSWGSVRPVSRSSR